MQNIYDYVQPKEGDELLSKLLSSEKVTINRIVSNQLENGGWYEQEEDEWLILLEGEAILEMDSEEITLKKGDTLFIEAMILHRVKKTSTNALWLTVHISS